MTAKRKKQDSEGHGQEATRESHGGVEPKEDGGPIAATAAVVASAGNDLPAYKDQVRSRDGDVGQRQKGGQEQADEHHRFLAPAAPLPETLVAHAAALPSFKDQVRECRKNDEREEEAAVAAPPATRPGAAFVNSRGVVSSQATGNHPMPQDYLVSAILVRPPSSGSGGGSGSDTNFDAVFTAEPLRRWTRNRILVFFAVLAAATAVTVTLLVFWLGKDEPVGPTKNSVPPTSPPDGPLVTKLTASDGAANDRFGWSVAISGDILVIGAIGDDDNTGSAYIYSRSDTYIWTEQVQLIASDHAANDEFGCSVAIDGDTIVVGAILDDYNGRDRGSAYIYSQSGTMWTEQVKLTASDGAPADYFGVTVAVSGDTTVVGSGARNDNGTESGSAYVFLRSGVTTWTEQAKLMASDGAANDWFGISIAISGDAMVIGAYLDGDNGANIGSSYIYTRTGTEWSEQAKLTASDANEKDWFGKSVAISDDTVVIGASHHDGDNGSNSGSAYVFLPREASWTEQVKLTANDAAADDEFGCRVAVHGDMVVIGASMMMTMVPTGEVLMSTLVQSLHGLSKQN